MIDRSLRTFSVVVKTLLLGQTHDTSKTQAPNPLRDCDIYIYIFPNRTYIAAITEASRGKQNVNNFNCVYHLLFCMGVKLGR